MRAVPPPPQEGEAEPLLRNVTRRSWLCYTSAHADPRSRYGARCLLRRRARHHHKQDHRDRIAGDETRPCRSADAGPGSFPGPAVVLSAAGGIALAADKPVVGLTTLTAYTAPFVAENAEY